MPINQENNNYSLLGIQDMFAHTSLSDLVVNVINQLAKTKQASGIFFLFNVSGEGWVLEAGLSLNSAIGRHSLAEAETKAIIPAQVLHHLFDSRQLFVLANALADERFATDPYFEGMPYCSVIAHPILSEGEMKGILLLENHQLLEAFNPSYIEFIGFVTQLIGAWLDNLNRLKSLERQLVDATLATQTLSNSEQRRRTIAKSDAFCISDDQGGGVCKVSTENEWGIQSGMESAVSENAFQLIAHTTPFAILLLDENNNVTYINQRFVELFGYRIEDIARLDILWQKIFPDVRDANANIEQMKIGVDEARKNQAKIKPQEFLVTCEDGIQKLIQFCIASANGMIAIISTDFTFRRQADLAFAASEEFYRIVFEKADVAIGISDNRGFLIKVNNRYEEMLGLPAEALIGKNPCTFTHPEDLSVEIDLYNECVAGRSDDYRVEKRFIAHSGMIVWIDSLITVIRDENGEPKNFVGFSVDITERKRAEDARIASEERFRQLFDKMPIPLAIVASNEDISHVNSRFIEIFGFPSSDKPSLNTLWLDVFPNPDYRQIAIEIWQRAVNEGKTKGEDIPSSEYITICKNGNIRTTLISGAPVGDDLLMLFLDISEQKQQQRKLEHIAHYDALTSLPNRVLLGDRLNHAMHLSRRNGHDLAVVYLDLDGFKDINDNYGHEVGDQLLLTLATRMSHVLRESDTISRLGGDEFVAVLSDISNSEDFRTLIHRLLDSANSPVHTENHLLQVSASLGITFYPQAEEVNADQLLRQADQAMYQAKLSGKNRYIIFDPKLDSNIRGQHEGIQRIRFALSENEFTLHYQPKVNLQTGEIIGVEALIRWEHPEFGLLIPEKFLPVIENHPLIIELGEWVIKEALSQIDKWQTQGLDIKISVNIAALQLQQSDFIDRLRALLDSYPNVNPSNLELEVLESSALDDMEHASDVINACREWGVHFALDDFGTGYSSLTYLKRLSAKILKIDKSFVQDLLSDPEDLAILEGVLGLAAASRRQVIAEGVETIAHGEMLLQIGCVLAQGYGIARPMAAEAIPAWLGSWCPDPIWSNCCTLSREDLPILTASVEHRAWLKGTEQFLDGKRIAPPRYKYHFELSDWLQIVAKNQNDIFPEFNDLEHMYARMHDLGTELFDLYGNGKGHQAKIKLKTALNLGRSLENRLKDLLMKVQSNTVISQQSKMDQGVREH